MTSDDSRTGDDPGASSQAPDRPHGDPLLNETESGDGPVQVPEVGKGTATSAEA